MRTRFLTCMSCMVLNFYTYWSVQWHGYSQELRIRGAVDNPTCNGAGIRMVSAMMSSLLLPLLEVSPSGDRMSQRGGRRAGVFSGLLNQTKLVIWSCFFFFFAAYTMMNNVAIWRGTFRFIWQCLPTAAPQRFGSLNANAASHTERWAAHSPKHELFPCDSYPTDPVFLPPYFNTFPPDYQNK